MTTQLSPAGGRLVVPLNDKDHVLGPPTAPVTMVEYGDYQCPFCAVVHPIVAEMLRQRPYTVRFAFRHFPLANIHLHAEGAAQTAEAAGVRGRFWSTHDWLLANQDRLDPVSLAAGLNELGLDGAEIADEVRAHRHLGKVRSDFVSGVHSGVTGTPTFFVNGLRHNGGYSLGELLYAVDRAGSAPPSTG